MSSIKHTMPLVTVRQSLLLRFLAWGAIVVFCLTIFSLSRWSGAVTVILLITGVVMSGITYIIKNYEVIGHISLTPDEIMVETLNEKFTFGLDTIKHLKVYLLEIAGEFNGGKAVTTKQGMYNFFKFEYEGAKKEFMFLLQDGDVLFLRAIFEVWRQKNIDFRLTNQTQQKFS